MPDTLIKRINRFFFGLPTVAAFNCCLFLFFAHALAFIHPGVLHTEADLERMKAKVEAGVQPWKSGWDRLVSNSFARTSYTPNPQDTVCCGNVCTNGETYMPLARDCAAAYQNALRYRISGNTAHADKAIQILNAWSSSLKAFSGDSNLKLRAGLYGYQFAAAAELLRGYSGWSATDFTRFKTMMVAKFYLHNSDFLKNHNGTCFDHYWANWDLANMASMIGIAVICDDTAKFYETVNYFKNGIGTGQIDRLCNNLYEGNPVLGQCQESGRDQGHATLCVALIGAFCQIAYNQGEDLFAYKNNKVLSLCEYTAKYNLGYDVPWTNYTNCENNAMTAISSSGRGSKRPCWELIYNHYARLKKANAPWSKLFADSVRPEGGGGDYGATSGGFDQLGFGTLTCTLDSVVTALRPVTRGDDRQTVVDWKLTDDKLQYSITAEAAVTMRIFTMKGTLVMTAKRIRFGAGRHVVPLALAAGSYYVEATINGRLIRKTIAVIR